MNFKRIALRTGLIAALVASSAFFLQEVTAGQDQLLAVAARTATTTNTDDQYRTSEKGLQVLLTVTTNASSVTLTPYIQGKDVNGTYYTLLQGTTSTASNYTTIMQIGQGVASTATSLAGLLPDIYRVQLLASTATAITYSVTAQKI